MKDTKVIETGGPAFPLVHAQSAGAGGGTFIHYGMTVRDWLAGQALTGLIASNDPGAGDRIEEIPIYAYRIADAMLRARLQSD